MESVKEEGLLSEYLTVSETDKGLQAYDVYRGLQLGMNQQDDGSVELVWAVVDHGITDRKVYQNPSEGYISFIDFLSCSKGCLETATAKSARHSKTLARLFKRYFGK